MTTAPTRQRSPRSGWRSGTSAPSTSAQQRFEKRLSAKRRRIWKLVGVLVILGALAVGGWWVLWRSDWLLVEQVVVTGSEARWEPQILAAAGVPMGQPLVQVDGAATEEAVSQVSIVRAVKVLHSWPSTVTIQVTPREPVIGVVQSSGQVSLVDADGAVIETTAEAPDALPVVLTEGAAGQSQSSYLAAWRVLTSLPASIADQVTATTVTSAELVTLQLGERTVIWGGPEDSELKAQAAEALLGTPALLIDVSAPRSPVTQGAVEPPEGQDGSDGSSDG